MSSRGDKSGGYPQAASADIEESRDGRHLLVWGGRPVWLVVDDELRALLHALDGTIPLDEVARRLNQPVRAVRQIARQLRRQGVLVDGADGVTGRKRPAVRIESIAINVTRRCNLRCSYCYAADDAAASDEISADEMIRFLRDVRPLRGRPCSLVLLGGEPFLEADRLLAVVAEGRRQRLDTIVSSNGTTITPEAARDSRRFGLEVQVSLDGATPETHNAVRGKGTFARAVAGVRTLLDAGVRTIVSMVCHRGNVDELEAFFVLARELGVAEARFIPLKRLGAAARSTLEPLPMNELLSTARRLLERRPEFVGLLGRDALSILANTCRVSAVQASCGTGTQTLLLDADGALYPCLNTCRPEFRFGDVRDEGYNLGVLWRSSSVLRTVRERTDVDRAGRSCSRCPVRYWCLGGCRGEALATTGTLDAPSPHCRSLRRAVLDMMWLLTESPGLVRPASRIC